MVKRTARKSVAGIVVTRSLMRKKVEPHTAVTTTSRSMAIRAREAGASVGTPEPYALDDGESDRAPDPDLGARRLALRPHAAEVAAEDTLDVDLEAERLQLL